MEVKKMYQLVQNKESVSLNKDKNKEKQTTIKTLFQILNSNKKRV